MTVTTGRKLGLLYTSDLNPVSEHHLLLDWANVVKVNA